jgi:hypothetical protein
MDAGRFDLVVVVEVTEAVDGTRPRNRDFTQ